MVRHLGCRSKYVVGERHAIMRLHLSMLIAVVAIRSTGHEFSAHASSCTISGLPRLDAAPFPVVPPTRLDCCWELFEGISDRENVFSYIRISIVKQRNDCWGFPLTTRAQYPPRCSMSQRRFSLSADMINFRRFSLITGVFMSVEEPAGISERRPR